MGILHASTRARVFLHTTYISKVETNMLSATSTTTSLSSCLRGYSLKQQQHSSSSAESSSSRRSSTSVMMRSSSEKKSSFTSLSSEDVGRTALLATIASSPIVLSAQDAFAKGGEFGLLEGRTAALVHPFFLGIMYATSLYAGYLGLQWRKVRTVGEEIQELKKASPVDADAETANPNQSKID